jgi:hypothetical protein
VSTTPPAAPGLDHSPVPSLVTASGLPPVRLHDLRHGAATLARASGADLKTVQEQLGHTSIALTADTYTSVLLELHFKVAEATARLVLAAAARNPGRHYRSKIGPAKSAASTAPAGPEPVCPKRSGKNRRCRKGRAHVIPKDRSRIEPSQSWCAARDSNP